MVWVRFTREFDFSPAALKGWSTTVYREGLTANVTRECADKAIAAAAAEKVTAPKRASEGPEEGLPPPPARR